MVWDESPKAPAQGIHEVDSDDMQIEGGGEPSAFDWSIQIFLSFYIMNITETKVSGFRAKEITDKLHFDGAFHANNIGYSSEL